MNRSLLTGRPFLPLCTGVSVHISFCRGKHQNPVAYLTRVTPPRHPPTVCTYDILQNPAEGAGQQIRTEQGGELITGFLHVAVPVERLDSRKPARGRSRHQHPSAHPPTKRQTHSFRFDRMLISTCEWLRTAVCRSESGPLLISQLSYTRARQSQPPISPHLCSEQ